MKRQLNETFQSPIHYKFVLNFICISLKFNLAFNKVQIIEWKYYFFESFISKRPQSVCQKFYIISEKIPRLQISTSSTLLFYPQISLKSHFAWDGKSFEQIISIRFKTFYVFIKLYEQFIGVFFWVLFESLNA